MDQISWYVHECARLLSQSQPRAPVEVALPPIGKSEIRKNCEVDHCRWARHRISERKKEASAKSRRDRGLSEKGCEAQCLLESCIQQRLWMAGQDFPRRRKSQDRGPFTLFDCRGALSNVMWIEPVVLVSKRHPLTGCLAQSEIPVGRYPSGDRIDRKRDSEVVGDVDDILIWSRRGHDDGRT